MRVFIYIFIFAIVCLFQLCRCAQVSEGGGKVTALPDPELSGKKTLEETIASRRSVRSFSKKKVDEQQLGQLLWAAQGITDERRDFRSVPSAGALYPLEVFAVTAEGVYQYVPKGHSLRTIKEGDARGDLYKAALRQSSVRDAPLVIVIAADYSRTAGKYGGRSERYVHMEAGHAAQNIHLQAVALGLGSVPIGAFSDDTVSDVLLLPDKLAPLYIIPVGYAD